jgi:negative regulator of sigma E activity
MHTKTPHTGPEQSAQLWHAATGTAAVAAAAVIVLLASWIPEAGEVAAAQPVFQTTAHADAKAGGSSAADARRRNAERLAAEHEAFLRQSPGTANLLRPDDPFPLQFWP